MRNICRKYKFWGLLVLLMLLAAGFTTEATVVETKAAVTGFRTVNGKTYYYRNGKKVTGWLTLDGKKYYFTASGIMRKGWVTNGKITRFFNTRTGAMATGWVANAKGYKRYFDPKTGYMKIGFVKIDGKYYLFNTKNGFMRTGWAKNSYGNKRYFKPLTGEMHTGWLSLDGKKYYMNPKTGYAIKGFAKDEKNNIRYFRNVTFQMATGWLKTSTGQRRYFYPDTGIMAVGFKVIDGNTYYFNFKTGVATTGWVSNSKGDKRYFDETTGVMATGTKVIDGKTYEFQSNGLLIQTTTGVVITQPSSERTIKNYLLGALQPVGQALYVWGGGWNSSTLKGVNPSWVNWYNSQSSSYDYNNYRDLSDSTRSKGLDCSGFVGWAAYQVMQTQSNVGYGYTVVAEDVGSYYKSLGWGTIVNQDYLSSTNWTLKAGDVGYNSGHTWIVIGQCSDKSAVIVHSTPNAGCQIAGTPTPSGNYSSQAIALAKQYMSRYKGYTKYNYHTSSGNYIRNGNYLRWYRTTLADPDGYLNMTADKILADLFK